MSADTYSQNQNSPKASFLENLGAACAGVVFLSLPVLLAAFGVVKV